MQQTSLGDHLRQWRRRRHMSQLDLALEAEISQKHLSFVESGRASPSREMVLRLAERLDVPRREQNSLLVAAGYAPLFQERPLDDNEMMSVRSAIDLVLNAQAPCPALAVDRHWNMVAANRAVPPLLEGVKPNLLEAPVNVLRLSLHPDGLAPRIVNLAEWREHILERLKRQATVTGDSALIDLFRELSGLGGGARIARGSSDASRDRVFVPLRLQTAVGTLDLISTTTLFGTPLDITMSEIAIESFLPADGATAQLLARLAQTPARAPPEP